MSADKTSPDVEDVGTPELCDGRDPMLGCFALDEPAKFSTSDAYWFPAYRALPIENLIDDGLKNDVRWSDGDDVSLTSFIKVNGQVEWEVHGRFQIAFAVQALNNRGMLSTIVATLSLTSFL